MQIKNNAVFIADSHFNFQRKTLYRILEDIQNGKIECSQLFLMGDIFDFLAGEVTYFVEQNQKAIELIQDISKKIEVYYLEGNHDYNLKKLFPDATVIARQEQPFRMNIDTRNVDLAHGDIFVGDGYDRYCKVIRNKYLLMFLNLFDRSAWITKIIEKKLAQKQICNKIGDFKYIVQKRINSFKGDIVLEGHYHEGKSYTFGKRKYINIPSLACSNEYIQFHNAEFIWKKYEKL